MEDFVGHEERSEMDSRWDEEALVPGENVGCGHGSRSRSVDAHD